MFTRLEARRIKVMAIAIALASWALPVAVGLFAVKSTRPIALAGFAFVAACLAASLLLAWSLLCPWCCQRLFFVSSMANSPGLAQLLRQCLPYDIVVKGRLTCPHCNSRFTLPGG